MERPFFTQCFTSPVTQFTSAIWVSFCFLSLVFGTLLILLIKLMLGDPLDRLDWTNLENIILISLVLFSTCVEFNCEGG